MSRILSLLGIWARQLRVHQWAKNLLVFIPLVAAHRLGNADLVGKAALACAAFSFTASAVYIANDMADLNHDRSHPRKRFRPLASGIVTTRQAMIAAAFLLFVSFIVASLTGSGFLVWLLAYLACTSTYTFWLKRLVLIDTLTLAGLFTLRIVAGGAATSTTVSQWLLAFSLFIFLSLAIAKRYVELAHHLGEDAHMAAGRGYRGSDAAPLFAMGIAAGFAATLVLTLYLSSPAVAALYPRQGVLWLTVPVLVYWLCWVWLSAFRGDMHDDPLVFSLTDRPSQIAGLLFVTLTAAASLGGIK